MTEHSIATPATKEPTLFGHPKGLYICFATEMWERFSFYGMKFLLMLYLTKYHLFSDSAGFDVLGAYAGLVYAMPVIGGLLADRYLGMRRAVMFGGALLVLGHLGMAIEGTQAQMIGGAVVRDEHALQVFYFSLSLIIVGVGFLKPNISTIVGKLYTENDPRRDSGFTIFYMGINTGALFATLICGWLGETYGWRYGFGAAGIGMILGLITFTWGQKFLDGKAEHPNPALAVEKVMGIRRDGLIYGGALLSLIGVWQLVQFHAVVNFTLAATSILVLLGLAWFLVKYCTPVERHRMIVLIVLTISTVVFWSLFEQASASMTLFADRVVDRHVGSWEVTASQIGGSLNSFFIILCAPVLVWIWTALAKRQWEPSTPVKFALGIVQAGLGFGALVIGAHSPDQSGKVAMIWLVLAYLLHTTGELCLSPVGLSAVTKLAVPRVVGVMMGAWFLATAYAEFVAAQLSKLAAVATHGGIVTDATAALSSYAELFGMLFWVGLGLGVLMLLLSPWLRRGMHGIH